MPKREPGGDEEDRSDEHERVRPGSLQLYPTRRIDKSRTHIRLILAPDRFRDTNRDVLHRTHTEVVQAA